MLFIKVLWLLFFFNFLFFSFSFLSFLFFLHSLLILSLSFFFCIWSCELCYFVQGSVIHYYASEKECPPQFTSLITNERKFQWIQYNSLREWETERRRENVMISFYFNIRYVFCAFHFIQISMTYRYKNNSFVCILLCQNSSTLKSRKLVNYICSAFTLSKILKNSFEKRDFSTFLDSLFN